MKENAWIKEKHTVDANDLAHLEGKYDAKAAVNVNKRMRERRIGIAGAGKVRRRDPVAGNMSE